MRKICFTNKTIIFSLFILSGLVTVAEAAWLDGWSRRAPVTITGSTVGAQTDYQIKLEVTYDTDMQGDFDDIRFTAADGGTLLDYWLEVSTPSVASTFWVEVSSIPAWPATTTIYIYYGNLSASSVSNGQATFILFDGFDYQDANADTALWTPRYEVGSSLGSADIGITESGKLRTYQDRATVVEDKKWYAVQGDGQQLPSDFVAEVNWNITTSYPDSASNSFEVRDVNQLTGTTGFVEIGRSYYYTGPCINGIHMSQDDANFYSVSTSVTTGKFRLRKLGNIIYGDYDIGSGWINLGNYSILYETYISFAAKTWVYEMTIPADGRWNDFRVRKYISPEPLVGPIGGEENGGSTTMFTDSSGADKTVYNNEENIYVTVSDADENNNVLLQETVTVDVFNTYTSDSEIITLTETGNDTGVFRNTSGLLMRYHCFGVPGNSQLEVVGGENINVNYTDDDDGGDTSSDTAVIGEFVVNSTTMCTDFSGGDKTSYNVTEDIYVTVTDLDEDSNSSSQQTVVVTVTNSYTGDSEIITLTETGNNTGIFRNTSGLPMIINPVGIWGNSQLEVVGGDNINVSYTDDDNAFDNSSDTAGLIDTILPQVPIINLTSSFGGRTMGINEKAIISGSVELGVSIYSIEVKDQRENVLSEGITTQVDINNQGEISGEINLGNLERCPLVTSIKVEIVVEDESGNRSTAGVSNYVAIMSKGNKVVAYNNVFNPKNGERCEIKIELVEDTHVSVKLYTLVGDLVKVLIDEEKQAGTEIIYWYGKNDFGDEVASGTYLLHIEAGEFKETKKICVIK